MSESEELKIHPVAALFALMVGDQFDAFVDDIRSNGLLEPITLHPDGRILDGRNRYRACLEADRPPRFETWSGKGTIFDFVVSKNLSRRHLTTRERSDIAAKLATLKIGDVSSQRDGKPNGRPSLSTKEAADLMKVSLRSVGRSKAAMEAGDTVMKSEENMEELGASDNVVALPQSPKPNGPQIAVPDGTTLSAMIADAMRRECSENSSNVAKSLGLNPMTYRKIRYIVLICARDDLACDDRAVSEMALAEMNRTRQVGAPFSQIESLVRRIYGERKGVSPARAEAIINEKFDRVRGLLSSLDNLDGVAIPYLSSDRKEKMLVEFNSLQNCLRAFVKRVKEGET